MLLKSILTCIACALAVGCASANYEQVSEPRKPTKYLELSSGHVWRTGDSGFLQCDQPEEFFCYPLPSGRAFVFPKSESRAIKCAALSSRAEDNGYSGVWHAGDITYFISEITDYALFEIEGPFYHVTQITNAGSEAMQFLETTLFSFGHGIVLTMEETEVMGIDAPVLLPTSVYVPVEYE